MKTKTIFDSDISKLPAYLLLAKLGKKVLRPGGLGFSKKILSAVSLTSKRVLEFAPGRGITAELIIKRNPSEYIGIEHHVDFANQLQFENPNHKIMVGSMAKTELPANSYDVIVGEAFLSLQADSSKQQILAEAYRLLKPGGVYLLHELSVVSANASGNLSEKVYQQMLKEMRDTLKVNATPLRTGQWRNLAQGIGFSIHRSFQRPMALLNRKRMIEDEGFVNVLKIFWNVLTEPGAFKRVRSIVSLFSKYENDLAAIGLILLKPLSAVSSER
jgi:ubiquinone/menaquinone biosynthesis C-methylase UbiE